MRVVILADFAEPGGGAQRVAIESARALAEAGARVTFIHAVGNGGDALLDYPAIERIGLGFSDVWELPAARAAAVGIWNRAAAQKLAGVLHGLPPEPTVIHLHQWTRAFSPAVFPVCLAAGRPFAVTLHDYFIACPNGLYYRFEKEAPCGLAPLSPSCVAAPCDPKSGLHKAIRVLRTLATRRMVRGGGFDVIHVSDRGRKTIAPFLPASVRHHRVDNPVAIPPREPAAIAQSARVAYIGRLTREKGADLFAIAAREAGVPALLIGEGPVADEISRHNPDAEVIGWRRPEEVRALLSRDIRAIVAPSRWYETGPLTVYEAAAAGVPAVVSARAGAAEKVAHGETGLVVEPQAAALAQALRTVSEIGTARRLGRAAYDRYWSAPLTPARHAERLLEVYQAMLAGRARSG